MSKRRSTSDERCSLNFPRGAGGLAPKGSLPAVADACRNASATGIRQALMVMALLCVWSALHYLLASRNLRKDLDTHYVAS